jgi:hypothetical protein
MRCIQCNRSPAEDPEVILIRQNEKGVTGIWLCTACGATVPDQVIDVTRRTQANMQEAAE